MAKFSTMVGYATEVENTPGVWTPDIIEKPHRAEVVKDFTRYVSDKGVNENITRSDIISIVSTPFALANLQNLRYVIRNNVKWKIISYDVLRPRITLNIGGVYNGNTTTAPE